MQNAHKDITLALFYFLLSAAITGWFIGDKYALYHSNNQMLLSGSIASFKWAVQIVGALFLLGDKKFEFIRRIAFVCLVGSAVLYSIYVIEYFLQSTGQQLAVAIGISITTMIILFYRAVFITDISIKWFFAWLCCTALTVFIQLTSIFGLV
jgi:hypothetical protein